MKSRVRRRATECPQPPSCWQRSSRSCWKKILESRVVQNHDTPVPAQDPDGKGIKTGRLSAPVGDHDHAYVVAATGGKNWFVRGKGQTGPDGSPSDEAVHDVQEPQDQRRAVPPRRACKDQNTAVAADRGVTARPLARITSGQGDRQALIARRPRVPRRPRGILGSRVRRDHSPRKSRSPTDYPAAKAHTEDVVHRTFMVTTPLT